MLYTGTGDNGTTNVFGCDQSRISKTSELPEALGTLDELNAFLGFVKMRATDSPRIIGAIRDVQGALFIIQAEVAGAEKKIHKNAVKHVENLIREIEKEIPPPNGFYIAGGTELSSLLDIARTLARRAERRVISVKEMNPREVSKETIAYMNRLSSLLFAFARLANHLAGIEEENPRY